MKTVEEVLDETEVEFGNYLLTYYKDEYAHKYFHRLLKAFRFCYKDAYGSKDIDNPMIPNAAPEFASEVLSILEGKGENTKPDIPSVEDDPPVVPGLEIRNGECI